MTTTTVRRLRWAAPFAAGAAVAVAAIIPGVAAGSDHPSLPALSATQLLTDLANAQPPTLSGTLVETARLGLPELPSTGAGTDAALSWQNLLTGSHTARVWFDGAQRQRIALVGDLAESDVVHNGTDVWIYTSSSQTAVHSTVSPHAKESTPEPSGLLSPSQAAAQALAAVDPTTTVSVDDTARVAGRPAYQIVFAPKDSRSLVSSVTVALDSETKVPLRVQVYARGVSDPAFETAFTDVSFTAPPASVFQFVPPTGATVRQATLAEIALAMGHARQVGRVAVDNVSQTGGPLTQPGGAAMGRDSGSRVIGSGWTAVLVTSVASPADGSGGPASAGQLLQLLSRSGTHVPQGTLIRTALLSGLITPDGQLYLGAVDATSLQQVAASGKPL